MWEKFNEKTAITAIPPHTCRLTVSSTYITLTFDNWYDVAQCTHALYMIDRTRKTIGVKFLNELDAADEDLALSYKINRNGYHRFILTCTKFIKTLPFQLVEARQTRRGIEAGKWDLKFVWHENEMIAEIKSEVENG